MRHSSLCRLFAFLFIASAFLFAGCKHKGEKAPHWFKTYSFYDNEAYQAYLMKEVQKLDDESVEFSEQIKNFYQGRSGALWTVNGFQEDTINILLDYIQHADLHGISPDVFGYTTANNNIQTLAEGKIATAEELYKSLASLELLLTDAYVQYAKDLAFGATNPKDVNGSKWLYETHTADAAFVEEALSKSSDLKAAFRSFQPTNPVYLTLQKELAKYISLKDSTFKDIPVIVADSAQTVARVHLIGERLLLIQEIDASYVPSDRLDAQLMTAINNFRRCRDIPVSKSLDEETIRELNRKPQYYIDKISANLERYRWQIAKTKGSDYVAVNIPAFMLKVMCADTLAMEMRICCGKYSSKRRHDTDTVYKLLSAVGTESPQLHSEINCVYLNPEWGITPSILQHEYYSKFVRNCAGVVKKEKLYFVDTRTHRQVHPESIDWKKISPSKIPYKVIQTSGRHNALGLVKFSFPNSESVYLHDTNSKGKFKARVRAFSHGCIRVEKPIELAELLAIRDFGEATTYHQKKKLEEKLEEMHIILGDEPETKEGEEFLEDMQKKEEEYYESLKEDTVFYRPLRPTPVFLKKKMPLYIEYYTCYIATDNKVHYSPDVYEKEGNVLCLLKRKEH